MGKSIAKVNWVYLVFYVVGWGAMWGLSGGLVTAQALGAIRKGLPIPGGWSWISVIGFDLTCVALFVWGIWIAYRVANTIISDEGVSQPRLTGCISYRWSEIEKVSVFGYGIHLHGPRGKIVLAPFAYRNPAAIIALVARMTEHPLKEDTP